MNISRSILNFLSNLPQSGLNFLRQRVLPSPEAAPSSSQPGSISTSPIPETVPTRTIEDIASRTLHIEENRSLQMTQEKLEEALNSWNPQTGDVEEAKKRILEAFKNNSTKLDLSVLDLSDLPKEIGNLQSLQTLILAFSNLNALPPEIGNLQSLQTLNLSYNRLNALPSEIGNLHSLQTLILTRNQVTSLPHEIGNLQSLQKLDLSQNQLNNLPPEIGNLQSLQELYLDKNQLNALPSEIGNLQSLQTLDLTYNSKIENLPLSLGNIPSLMILYCTETSIPKELTRSILAQCQLLRARENALPKRIDSWYATAQRTQLLNISHLTEKEQSTLNEWLIRLEKTKDFGRRQVDFANLVLEILEKGLLNEKFKEFFFLQAEANNACCGDRAAMALNEIYTHWYNSIKTLELSDTKEQLEAFIGVAKTGLLRKKLAQLIKENSPNEQESVEIYLYYETLWKEELGLISASEGMLYSVIGERKDWVTNKKEEIKKFVLNNFTKELCEQSFFTEWFLKKAPQNKSEWDKIEEVAHEEVDVLMEKKAEIENEEPPFKKRKLEEGAISKEELECQMYQVMEGIKIKRAKIIHNWIKIILK